jgi:hypothetical protein
VAADRFGPVANALARRGELDLNAHAERQRRQPDWAAA